MNRGQLNSQALVARLNGASLPNERSWKVLVDENGLTMAREVRGVGERYHVDAAALRSADVLWLAEPGRAAGA